MAVGTNIRTYFNGTWHDGDVPIMRAADHGTWLGSSVFDGARYFEGVSPDLLAHCERVNRSAEALMITPSVSAEDMVQIVAEGLKAYTADQAVYIRPTYWALDGGDLGVLPKQGATGFAICLEQISMPLAEKTTTLTRTKFCRPVLSSSVCNAKAGCLYPNNARMLADATSRGFGNALVADALGNVAETATSNVFLVRDGVVFTPIPNGTFLAGITRSRHMRNLTADGVEVVETVLSFDDFDAADEVFITGNMSKIMSVTAFDDVTYPAGPVAGRARELYWDWALSNT